MAKADAATALSIVWGNWRLHGLHGHLPPASDLFSADPEAQREAEDGYAAGARERLAQDCEK